MSDFTWEYYGGSGATLDWGYTDRNGYHHLGDVFITARVNLIDAPETIYRHEFTYLDGLNARITFHVDLKQDVANGTDKTIASYNQCDVYLAHETCQFNGTTPINSNYYYYETYFTLTFGSQVTSQEFDTRRWTKASANNWVIMPAALAGG